MNLTLKKACIIIAKKCDSLLNETKKKRHCVGMSVHVHMYTIHYMELAPIQYTTYLCPFSGP